MATTGLVSTPVIPEIPVILPPNNLTTNVNQLVLLQAVQLMKGKVAVASMDGKFSSDEIISLTMASIHVVQELFPYVQSTQKQEIATHIIQTVISQLIAENVLSPELGAVLGALPIQTIIDGFVLLMKKANGWFKRNWPVFKSWAKLHLCCCCFSPIESKRDELLLPSTRQLSVKQINRINDIILPLDVTSIKANAFPLIKKS